MAKNTKTVEVILPAEVKIAVPSEAFEAFKAKKPENPKAHDANVKALLDAALIRVNGIGTITIPTTRMAGSYLIGPDGEIYEAQPAS